MEVSRMRRRAVTLERDPRRHLSWFLSCVVAFAVNSTNAADLTPAPKLIATPRVLITAHRGNSSVTPENTLPAFQSALDVKADLVELDYFHSADGVPIVIHDEMLERTTDAEEVIGKTKLNIVELFLADFHKIDVG